MNNFYHINHLPKLDSFNKIHINYINKPNNYVKNNIVINKKLDLNKDLISLTTSFLEFNHQFMVKKDIYVRP